MLLDTAGLLNMISRREKHHAIARTYYELADLRLTHSYVLAELIALAQKRKVSRRDTLNGVVRVVADPEVKVVWVDQQLHQNGIDLLLARADKRYSLCDAVSFALMRRAGLAEALTTGKHFEQEGFTRLLK